MRSRYRIPLALAAITGVTVTTTVVRCHTDVAAEKQFVTQFLVSAFNDTDFYRQYLSKEDIDSLNETRSMMSTEFALAWRDWLSNGYIEWRANYPSGAAANVVLSKKGGSVVSVRLRILPSYAPTIASTVSR